MAQLYEITSKIEALLDRAYDSETGEIRDADLDKLLDELHADRDKRALDIAAATIDFNAEGEKIEKRAKELLAWSRVLYAKAERLRKYLAENLPVGHKIADDRAKIGWRRSDGVVLDRCVEEMPERWLRVKREVALSDLRDALKAGDAEAAQVAHLEARHSIQVK